ncbi:MAG TPA: F0F1 ATP synthase subunit alpha [Candidatus Avoscillospira stercoripullorum]|uniref:ATP synthase subunit alpha n=1 Tax=Candidatus Avoscillospira stercoripullorum TaxID=2840709 RepID=A0A9D1A990_9FIRM|nr:F0F1 ATP synthase subunit alpha [Candidatus Avoscillospira stercoripullorum]
MLRFDIAIGEFLKERLEGFSPEMVTYEYGRVKSVQDGIVQVEGLPHAKYGELLEFEGQVYGMALDMSLTGVGAALLGKADTVVPGSVVRGTGRISDVCVGRELLGRVVDPIGRPLDGMPLKAQRFREVECPAPAIMDRAPVDTPMETGILAIDSMIPIGRGQRELIIGDRQTGKTTIALSTMLNQKDSGVISVYCAIGQKAASVAGIVRQLQEAGALERCVVVAATASDSAAMQYLAPYAACAIAEEFMHQGKDVLVVYDDLSKHAVAYRTMSLLLRRPSGREAYPGDVFYLHSRLLERAAHLSKEQGGGSITALPIVETMAGDISAYIPTNVISITDGQIFLESELFHAGVRPAVNVGLSVSRVGRSAQHPAMRDVSGSLRLEVAQYRDMAVFAQFGADVDAETKKLLDRGARMTELLKQSQQQIYKLSAQVALLLAYGENLLQNIPTQKVGDFAEKLLAHLYSQAASGMKTVDTTKRLSQSGRRTLTGIIRDFAKSYEA